MKILRLAFLLVGIRAPFLRSIEDENKRKTEGRLFIVLCFHSSLVTERQSKTEKREKFIVECLKRGWIYHLFRYEFLLQGIV